MNHWSMRKKLVFATHNQHKIYEVTEILNRQLKKPEDDAAAWEIASLSDLGFTDDIPETADSLEGNALLKAMHIVTRYDVDCFADDTGLEVEALDGRPGVFSARYAGESKNFDDNINKVLGELQGINNRKARFRTIVALVLSGQVYYFEGIINGWLIHEKHGSAGFGYDPIFIPDGYDKTFAEMTLDEKNKISHRAQAIGKLCNFLTNHSPG